MTQTLIILEEISWKITFSPESRYSLKDSGFFFRKKGNLEILTLRIFFFQEKETVVDTRPNEERIQDAVCPLARLRYQSRLSFY